jgi:purine-cytosine permease-like protein
VFPGTRKKPKGKAFFATFLAAFLAAFFASFFTALLAAKFKAFYTPAAEEMLHSR